MSRSGGRDEAGLIRVIGVPGIAFTAFNSAVGVGIFGLPGLVAAVLGPAAILAYLVCLGLIGLVGLCFAESASRVPDSGGLYAYAGAAFGPVVGGVAGALLLFANSVASAAALARFFLDTLAGIWPLFMLNAAAIALLALIYAVLATINIHGTRDGTRLTVALGFLKLAPLVLLILIGLFAIRPANLTWPGIPPIAKVGEGSLILFFAFMGLESGLNISGEARDPARTIPRALALVLAMVAALYIGLQLSAQGVLGSDLAVSKAPLVDTARAVFGSWGAGLLLAASLLSVGGFLVADMLSSPRVAFALAEARQLPRWVAYVHPRHRTPSVAIGLYAAMVVIVTASGSFRQIATLSVAGTLLLYLITCIGLLRLRAKGVQEAGRPFVAPGGPLVPLAAAATILWLLSTLAWIELAATLAFVIVAALTYAIAAALRRVPIAPSTSP